MHERCQLEVKAKMSSGQRRLAILADLLIWNQRLSFNELAVKFHVGSSLIQNALKWLRETFPTIVIESDKGRHGISGSGTDFMKSLVVFNTYGVRKMSYCIYSSLINLASEIIALN